MDGNGIYVDFYSEKDKLAYTNFIFSRYESNIYHTLEWKESLEEYYHFKPFYLIARDQEKNIRAILPLFYLKNWNGTRLDSLPQSIYGGILGDENCVLPLLKKTFELKEKMKCNNIVIRQLPPGYEKIFEDAGMEKSERRWSQIIKIKPHDFLWKEIKKSNRYMIRKAISNGITIRIVENKEDLKDLYKLENILGVKRGFLSHPLGFFEKLWDKMYCKGYLKVFMAQSEKQIIASNMILPFNKVVVCRIINSNYESMKPGANNLLAWEAIKWSENNGYSTFDFGATYKNMGGLFFFKSTFNTINLPFSHFYFPKNTIILDETPISLIGKRIIRKIPVNIYMHIASFIERKFC